MNYILNFLRDLKAYFLFRRSFSSSLGIYSSFKEASEKNKVFLEGYNNAETVARYQSTLDSSNIKLNSFEYAPFFWLSNIIKFNDSRITKVFDYGGNLGGHYYKFVLLSQFKNLNWKVCEVPALVEAGNEITKDDRLRFTSDFKQCENMNILISFGAIQYIEDSLSLSLSLSLLKFKPQNLILARLPVQNKIKTYVTFQNMKTSFAPQYIFNREDFINGFLNIGYELVDEWQDKFDSCVIPFHRDISCYCYTGFYFRLKNLF